MPSPFIVMFAGNPSSGKDTQAKLFGERFEAPVIGVSNIISQYASERGITLDGRESFRRTHARLRAELGQNYIPNLLQSMDCPLLGVSGQRVVAYNQILRENGARTVAYTGSLATRYHFSKQDDRNRGRTIREFWREEAPEYFSDDPYGPATMTVMSLAELKISIHGKTVSEIHEETVIALAPDLQAHGIPVCN